MMIERLVGSYPVQSVVWLVLYVLMRVSSGQPALRFENDAADNRPAAFPG